MKFYSNDLLIALLLAISLIIKVNANVAINEKKVNFTIGGPNEQNSDDDDLSKANQNDQEKVDIEHEKSKPPAHVPVKPKTKSRGTQCNLLGVGERVRFASDPLKLAYSEKVKRKNENFPVKKIENTAEKVIENTAEKTTENTAEKVIENGKRHAEIDEIIVENSCIAINARNNSGGINERKATNVLENVNGKITVNDKNAAAIDLAINKSVNNKTTVDNNAKNDKKTQESQDAKDSDAQENKFPEELSKQLRDVVAAKKLPDLYSCIKQWDVLDFKLFEDDEEYKYRSVYILMTLQKSKNILQISYKLGRI